MKKLIILMFLGYFGFGFQLFSVGSYGVIVLDLLTALFLFLFAKRIFWDGEELKLGLNAYLFFFTALILASLLSSINPVIHGSTDMLTQYIKTTVHFLFLVVFPFICAVFPQNTKLWDNVIKLLLILSLFINIFGIYQIIARAYELPFAWLEFSNVSFTHRGEMEISDVRQLSLRYGNFYRATSIFPEPSALASFNVVIVIFILIPFVQGTKRFLKSKTLTALVFIFSVLALFLTFSMTGFVGLMMVLGAVFVFERTRRLLYLLSVFIVTFILIAATDNMVKSYANISVLSLFQARIEGIMNYGSRKVNLTTGESMGVRLETGRRAYLVWQEHPITGIGLGLSDKSKKVELAFSDFSMMAALAELGIIGFLAFIGLFAALFFKTLKFMIQRAYFSDMPEDLKRLMGLTFYLVLHQIMINFITGNNLVNYELWQPMGMIFGILLLTDMNRGYKIVNITFFSIPPKEQFRQSLGQFIKKREAHKLSEHE